MAAGGGGGELYNVAARCLDDNSEPGKVGAAGKSASEGRIALHGLSAALFLPAESLNRLTQCAILLDSYLQ